MNIDTLKKIVTGRNPKLKQIHILLLCLNHVEQNPSDGKTVGCLWNSDSSFIINTQIHGKFIERLPNTMNRGLRCHGFKWTKTSRIIRENIPDKFKFNEFPDQLNWDQRSCPGFTKSTTEAEAINWKYHDLIPKNPRKPKIPKSSKISSAFKNIEESDFSPFDDASFDEFVRNLRVFDIQKPEFFTNQIQNQATFYPQNFVSDELSFNCNNYNPQLENISSSSNFQNNVEEENQKREEESDLFFETNLFSDEENQDFEIFPTFDINSYNELELEEHNDSFMNSSSDEIFY